VVGVEIAEVKVVTEERTSAKRSVLKANRPSAQRRSGWGTGCRVPGAGGVIVVLSALSTRHSALF